MDHNKDHGQNFETPLRPDPVVTGRRPSLSSLASSIIDIIGASSLTSTMGIGSLGSLLNTKDSSASDDSARAALNACYSSSRIASGLEETPPQPRQQKIPRQPVLLSHRRPQSSDLGGGGAGKLVPPLPSLAPSPFASPLAPAPVSVSASSARRQRRPVVAAVSSSISTSTYSSIAAMFTASADHFGASSDQQLNQGSSGNLFANRPPRLDTPPRPDVQMPDAKKPRHDSPDEQLSETSSAHLKRLRSLETQANKMRDLVISTYTEKSTKLLILEHQVEQLKADNSARQKRLDTLVILYEEESRLQENLRNRITQFDRKLLSVVESTKFLLRVSAAIKLMKSRLRDVVAIQSQCTREAVSSLTSASGALQLCHSEVQKQTVKKEAEQALISDLEKKLRDADEKLQRSRSNLELATQRTNILEEGQRYLSEILEMRDKLTTLVHQRCGATSTAASDVNESRIAQKELECNQLERQILELESQRRDTEDDEQAELLVLQLEEQELDDELLKAENALEAERSTQAEEDRLASLQAAAEHGRLLERLSVAELTLQEEQMLDDVVQHQQQQQQPEPGGTEAAISGAASVVGHQAPEVQVVVEEDHDAFEYEVLEPGKLNESLESKRRQMKVARDRLRGNRSLIVDSLRALDGN